MMAFSEIQGQRKAVTLMERALAGGRLSHAYLFSGPDGVGKTTMARAVAALLLCTAPGPDHGGSGTGVPCGRCGGCLQLASGNHPDLVEIRPDGAAIKIGQVRKLKEALAFAPFAQGYRVVLLEEVHTLRREAGNSLLKLLEEPPHDNIFILIGSSSEAMLPTIVSRCQVIPFFPLPQEIAAGIIAAKRADLSPGDAAMLAALAEGCPGQALAMDSDGLLEVYTSFLSRLIQASPRESGQVEAALAFAARMTTLKEGLPLLLQLFRIFFKEVMVSRFHSRVSALPGEELKRARELWNLDQLSAKITAIDSAEQALARNCNRGLTCEVLLLDLFDCGS
ncbi:DNA polymerase III subunit delta' [Desulfogranum mediterraneum]|uniref:DNA polymerase III subunit delta' n=1 Tax=Desulfogranum mediterraneum TaxID=160661 RepID=UPI00041A1D6B|nr:DNA polymerase III subunit delta' [Desulfogranum mediterraneum]